MTWQPEIEKCHNTKIIEFSVLGNLENIDFSLNWNNKIRSFKINLKQFMRKHLHKNYNDFHIFVKVLAL